MAARERPLSPHLTIYRPQITSVLSITHRITGVLLSAAGVVLVVALWLLAGGERRYQGFVALLGSHGGMLGWALLAGSVFSLCYHLLNGIRHLAWDAGKGLDLKTTEASGWAVVIGSLLATSAVLFAFARGGA